MHLLSVLATALSLLGTALAASDEQVKPLVSTRDSGATSRQKSYIVKLKADAPKDKHLDWLSSKYASSAHVTHGKWTSDLLHGYAGEQLLFTAISHFDTTLECFRCPR